MRQELLRRLPQVEKALQWPEIEHLLSDHSRGEVLGALREALDSLRGAILAGKVPEHGETGRLEPEAVVTRVRHALAARQRSGYRRVINGTGILLHTGLGRAVLSEAALEAFTENLRGYSVVEIDLESGERNQREAPLRQLLVELTGASAATVVNNNAAATLLILAALARGKEVVISRGQLVEIGGSFRIPDILKESGARLVEVGTTNRTYLDDYRRAINPETGLLLSVHTSNYEIRGFAHHTPLEELTSLGKEHGIPVVSDLGSGCFLDLSPFGFRREPLVTESVDAGADLVCFSGDKLLGGPQAGIIVGNEEAVAKVRSHPLYRTLRVDKVTLTLLEATLRLYRDPEKVFSEVPALRAMSTPADDVRRRAEAFRDRVAARKPAQLEFGLTQTTAEMGSGSLPAQGIPSWAVSLRHDTLGPDQLAHVLRHASPPVMPRIQDERLLLDFRTVQPDDEAALEKILSGLK